MSSASLEKIIESIETLSIEEQDDLLALIIKRKIAKRRNEIAKNETNFEREQTAGNFWDALQNFRAKLERENIVFNDEDFADLRDKSPGKEVEL